MSCRPSPSRLRAETAAGEGEKARVRLVAQRLVDGDAVVERVAEGALHVFERPALVVAADPRATIAPRASGKWYQIVIAALPRVIVSTRMSSDPRWLGRHFRSLRQLVVRNSDGKQHAFRFVIAHASGPFTGTCRMRSPLFNVPVAGHGSIIAVDRAEREISSSRVACRRCSPPSTSGTGIGGRWSLCRVRSFDRPVAAPVDNEEQCPDCAASDALNQGTRLPREVARGAINIVACSTIGGGSGDKLDDADAPSVGNVTNGQRDGARAVFVHRVIHRLMRRTVDIAARQRQQSTVAFRPASSGRLSRETRDDRQGGQREPWEPLPGMDSPARPVTARVPPRITHGKPPNRE
jgi:hypothetical protein